jgi:hypothetical protein
LSSTSPDTNSYIYTGNSISITYENTYENTDKDPYGYSDFFSCN